MIIFGSDAKSCNDTGYSSGWIASNAFVLLFRLFAPTIEEYANHVEADKIIEAGNSYRGILYEIGKLLRHLRN